MKCPFLINTKRKTDVHKNGITDEEVIQSFGECVGRECYAYRKEVSHPYSYDEGAYIEVAMESCLRISGGER